MSAHPPIQGRRDYPVPRRGQWVSAMPHEGASSRALRTRRRSARTGRCPPRSSAVAVGELQAARRRTARRRSWLTCRNWRTLPVAIAGGHSRAASRRNSMQPQCAGFLVEGCAGSAPARSLRSIAAAVSEAERRQGDEILARKPPIAPPARQVADGWRRPPGDIHESLPARGQQRHLRPQPAHSGQVCWSPAAYRTDRQREQVPPAGLLEQAAHPYAASRRLKLRKT